MTEHAGYWENGIGVIDTQGLSFIVKNGRVNGLAQKRKRRLLLASLLTIGFFAWAGWTLLGLKQDIGRQEAYQAELMTEQEMLRQEQERLEEELQKMNDPEHIAKLARKNYFMTYPGEILFIPTNDP